VRGIRPPPCGLGALYERGEGVPKSPRQAFDWYLKAADDTSREAAFQGWPRACSPTRTRAPGRGRRSIVRAHVRGGTRSHRRPAAARNTVLPGARREANARLAAKCLERAADGSPRATGCSAIVYAASSAPESRAKGCSCCKRYDAGDAVAPPISDCTPSGRPSARSRRRPLTATTRPRPLHRSNGQRRGGGVSNANFGSLELLG